MEQWFFNDAGRQHGPVDRAGIQSMLAAGKIFPGTLVWNSAMADWKPAREVPQLEISPYATPAFEPVSGIDWSGYTPSGSQIRPWVRYWARTLDFLLFALIVGMVVLPFYPDFADMGDTLMGMVLLFSYCFVEPVVLSVAGNTPFKALLRIRVRNEDGSKLSYGQGLRRMVSIWVRGQGLGLGIIALITLIVSYRHLRNDGITWWDAGGKFTVTHQDIQWWRWSFLIVIMVGFFALVALGESM